MIRVRRLDGGEMVLNAELIQDVQERPDTIITLTTGKSIVVSDSPAELTERVVAYRREIGAGPLRAPKRKENEWGS
ncbi:MAG: flagellar protein [Gemmatimonadetes bacterium]|nr:flagellar protein [Gemmatimonadota bacterium]